MQFQHSIFHSSLGTKRGQDICQESEKQQALKAKITSFAKNIGFDLVGFSPAMIEEKYLRALEEWLKESREGQMAYMQKIEQRRDLGKVLPGAKSVIVLATNYYHEQTPPPSGHGIVARYAYGRDYHKTIGGRLKILEKFVKEVVPAAQTKAYVDTGPVLERALAEQAGLGRIGKNTCLITPEFGSWVLLSEIITTLDLLPRHPKPTQQCCTEPVSASQEHRAHPRWRTPSEKSFNVCGNCTRCMQACPTGAIIAPGVVDARLCISYLTIENRKRIPPKLAKIIGKTRRIFGCDICQEVCPLNGARKKSLPSAGEPMSKSQPPAFSGNGLFSHTIAGDHLNLGKIKSIKTDQQFLKTFAGSPLMRAKRKGLQRNIKMTVDTDTSKVYNKVTLK